MFNHIHICCRAFILLLALILPACNNIGLQDLSTATPGLSGPKLLFEDDFGDDRSGWLEAADAESSQGYRNGQFFFDVRAADLIVWDNAGGNFQDLALEIEARQVSGDPENSCGVLFRYVDEGNFYRFDLGGDGYFAVYKLERGEWSSLVDWQASVHVRPQGEINYIEVVCQGPVMTFYVNGQELTSVEDSSFERGDVGLFASTFTGPNVEVEFDNLEIWETE
jgi:hypothetical protein